MPRYLVALVVASLALISHITTATNQYPVVLVHGFGGWGRSELLGFKYWGGNNNDYQKRLQEDRLPVMTAEIGPFSSNWDRACELYAYIKGGRVDYGANHAAKHGHARYGRTYPGLYPQWGTVVNGKIQKIHLVGHSMGGQTIRMLVQLLNKGTAGAPITEAANSHPLFAGGKDWVHSVTTVSSPNQGTTLADGWASTVARVETALISWFGIGGLIPDLGVAVYDVKLDQWGVTARGSFEPISVYVHRILSSSFFSSAVTDNSRVDLSTKGAKAINSWVKTLPNVYYYSINTQDTFSFIDFTLKKVQLPNPATMLIALQPCGIYMGSRSTVSAGFPKDWMANDGQVNTPSQFSDGTGKVVDLKTSSTRGAWNKYPVKNYCDHFAITGNSIYFDTYDLFYSHSKVLLNLPAQEEIKRRLSENGDVDVHHHPEELVAEIEETHRSLEARGRTNTIRMCEKNKGLTSEQTSLCRRFLETVAPGVEMAPTRNLRA